MDIQNNVNNKKSKQLGKLQQQINQGVSGSDAT